MGAGGLMDGEVNPMWRVGFFGRRRRRMFLKPETWGRVDDKLGREKRRSAHAKETTRWGREGRKA